MNLGYWVAIQMKTVGEGKHSVILGHLVSQFVANQGYLTMTTKIMI